MAWRHVNIFFVVAGFVVMVKDYKKHKNAKVICTQVALLCLRCEFYFDSMSLVILVFLISGY